MFTTEKCKIVLKHYEGLRLKPYNDQNGREIKDWCKGATIGYGHLIAKDDWDKYKNGISAEQANDIFDSDLLLREKVVTNLVHVPLKTNEFDALVILQYNIGENALRKSSLLKMINSPGIKTSYDSLESAWKAWNKSGGSIMGGLIKRRQAEWDIFSKGIYYEWS